LNDLIDEGSQFGQQGDRKTEASEASYEAYTGKHTRSFRGNSYHFTRCYTVPYKSSHVACQAARI